ncbi:MAG: hypothetical protein SFZ03_12070 [Candidatus Melainabacteria bacterium]|nr:hypothetical protein [Candidatus Melainabacteria bacterium]
MIEKQYRDALPLPNPDIHELIGEALDIPPSKVFFGINLVRQKMKLPKLDYPKRKLAVTPDQMMAIQALYEPYLPVPPIGIHKILAKQLRMDEWRVHVAIGLIRKSMQLPRWNEDREDLPDAMREQIRLHQEEKAKKQAEAEAQAEAQTVTGEANAPEPADADVAEKAPKPKPSAKVAAPVAVSQDSDVASASSLEDATEEPAPEEAPVKPVRRGRKVAAAASADSSDEALEPETPRASKRTSAATAVLSKEADTADDEDAAEASTEQLALAVDTEATSTTAAAEVKPKRGRPAKTVAAKKSVK